jgi:peroxiredoxin Q/BCP
LNGLTIGVDPTIFQAGPFMLRWYSLLVVLAIVGGAWLGLREARRKGLDVEKMQSLIFWGMGATAVAVVGVAVIALGAVFFANNQGGSAGGQASGGSANGQANGAGEYAFQVGDPGPGAEAPPIELPSTDGGKFNLSATRGETTLLYFHGGVMCQPCYDQVVDIEAQWGKFEELGIDNFAGITHDPLDASKQAVNTMELSTPVLYDEEEPGE